MTIEKYIAGACFSLIFLAGCDYPNNYVPPKRISQQKPAYEKNLCKNKSYNQMTSTSNYNPLISTNTSKDDHSPIGITIIKLPGTPLGIDAGGNLGIRPTAILDDDDDSIIGFGGIQINP